MTAEFKTELQHRRLLRPIRVIALLMATASIISSSAAAACSTRGSHDARGTPPSSTMASGSASPAPAEFAGMWQNSGGQALIVEKAGSGFVGTLFDGGVKALKSDLRDSGDGLTGVGKPADRWKVAYDVAKGRLVLSGPWAPMSFTKAPPGAEGLGGSSSQTDPFTGQWRGLGMPNQRGGLAVIVRSGDGYRVSTVAGGQLLDTYTFVRKGDLIQGVPSGTPKPKDTIRWVFRFKGRPGQLVMKLGNGLPHYFVRTGMTTSVPTSSPAP